MLRNCQARLLDDVYLNDIPHIAPPETAYLYLSDTVNPGRIVREWDLPDGYLPLVRRYLDMHFQQPHMAYRDALNEVKSGNIVILRRDHGTAYGSIAKSDGSLIGTLPLFLRSRLESVISRQLTRPIFTRSLSPTQHVQAGKTINSKAAGRLLAAGGIYNGNPQGFRQTAEQLGGDAAKGYDSVLNETTSGLMVAAASLLVIRNPVAAEELTSYLGKYKKAHVLLDDVNVSELNYVRRDRVEYAALRGEFNNSVRPNFLKSLANHPDALSTFDSNNLLRLADGKVPPGWQVHHKIPLDDSGTNGLDNLILIQNSPYHSALSKTQAIITKDLPYNATTNVLWPSPNGVIYPVGK